MKLFGRKKFLNDYTEEIKLHLTPDSLIINWYSFPDEGNLSVDICVGCNDDFTRLDEECLTTIEAIFQEHGFSVCKQINNSHSMAQESSCQYKSLTIGLNRRIFLNGIDLRSDAYKVSAVINRVYETLKE